MNYLLATLFLVISILAYFKAAILFNIVDVPNHRSSHQEITIRGAGIIFPLSVIFCGVIFGDIGYLLMMALCLISIVSFADDVVPLPSLTRFVIHLVAVSLVMFEFNLYVLWPVWMTILAYIIAFGTINAFNFMDGINGITGIYSLVTLFSMAYINKYITEFADSALLLCPAIACIIFLYFNFRKKAFCFAGDVGSIGIAFWLMVLSVMLIEKTGSYKYLFLFSLYSVDVLYTLVKRIRLKQNPFHAHRLHTYQLLVNNGGYGHRLVASLYGVIQLLINIFILTTDFDFGIYLFLVVFAGAVAYLFFEHRYKLQPFKMSVNP